MTHFLLGLLNPHVGFGALLVAALTFLIWQIHKNHSKMDPELAKVRVWGKVVRLGIPRNRRSEGDSFTATEIAEILKEINSAQASLPDSKAGSAGDPQGSPGEARYGDSVGRWKRSPIIVYLIVDDMSACGKCPPGAQ
ncbi:hypothetical protein [Amycolatopsis keratiniphila]|uniref:hypothetical protein n=1 Tax=Amycolatopsis keratiniphila TaxID=129921 RepID=UPI000F515C99|nr:hypothetical protein [Amycolatopsis keratiniphila]